VLRESVEVATDAQCEVMVDSLGRRFDDLMEMLIPWGRAVSEAGGYPSQGPHDLAPLR